MMRVRVGCWRDISGALDHAAGKSDLHLDRADPAADHLAHLDLDLWNAEPCG
jgi:hypothetical protein